MCGIFGLIVRQNEGYEPAFIKKSLMTLAQLSESRGKDSSGLVFRNEFERELHVCKGAVFLNDLLKRTEVAHQIDRLICSSPDNPTNGNQRTFAVMGHSRLVTNGSQLNESNNQPVVKAGIIGIHNGIIVNENELWSRHPEIHRTSEIDTEVMLALVRKYLRDNWDVATAVSKTVNEIFGTVAAAFFIDDINVLALATNNGSLYVFTNEIGLFAFASEEYFLKRLSKTMHLDTNGNYWIRQVVSGKGVLLDLEHFRLSEFSFSSEPNRSSLDTTSNIALQDSGAIFFRWKTSKRIDFGPLHDSSSSKIAIRICSFRVQYRSNSGPSQMFQLSSSGDIPIYRI